MSASQSQIDEFLYECPECAQTFMAPETRVVECPYCGENFEGEDHLVEGVE